MERRLELALEGNRWFDLVRWGEDYLVSTMNKYMTEEAKLRQYYEGRSVTANESSIRAMAAVRFLPHVKIRGMIRYL